VTADDPLRIEVDPASPVGSIIGVTLAGVRVAVIRLEVGWVMLPDRCPHAGCSFVDDDGEVADGTTLVCACHGSEFDLRDGRVLQGPAATGVEVTALEPDGDGLRPRSL
jgi:nitrite reductase/ring-hydroxylating ferredoxin subunit